MERKHKKISSTILNKLIAMVTPDNQWEYKELF